MPADANWLYTFIGTLLVIVAGIGLAGLLLFVWSSLYVIEVANESMRPAFKHGDRVLVWRYWPKRWLRKGQVVLVWPHKHAPGNPWALARAERRYVPFIKRIVAMEGDTVVTQLTDLHQEDQLDEARHHDSAGNRTWHIPPDHLFLRGDNRRDSVDSLVWGPVPDWCVMGIVLMKLPASIGPRSLRKETGKGVGAP
ncbi:MAG TPA: signal peptidase I [Chloroflexia bacterium]|jgi:signal peptidase I